MTDILDVEPSPPRTGRPLSIVHKIIVGVWAVAVFAGMLWIWDYKTIPGRASSPPVAWPESVGLKRSGVTLVMTLHPLCPCSQASVSELARLLGSIQQRPTVYALFVGLEANDAEATKAARVEDASLWQRASAIPGVTAIPDPDGTISRAFAGETSGDVIAYGANGELLYHGGLTAARGHEGDSFGLQRLRAVLRGDTPDLRSSPTFGCPLVDPRKDGVKL
ncbi:MAG TPA: hypothetical protein VJM31_12705 [Vicinamibacterales bacterium]|nr:hypothetical protein [Vicinamibacterales bacterium]